MIQDIAPHTYDLTYRTTAPGETDLALCCRAGQVLLQQEDGLWRLPAFEALPDTLQVNRSRARHLFRIDKGHQIFSRRLRPRHNVEIFALFHAGKRRTHHISRKIPAACIQ